MLAAAACDIGKQANQKTVGPAIRILGVNVGDGRPLPADGAVQIAFDRYLLPATVLRQGIGILDSAGKELPSELLPAPIYDPVARTVTLAPPKQPWLTEGDVYKLVLSIPEGDSLTGGVRAIDGAKLFADQKLEYSFVVGPKTGASFEPGVSFCRDVLPIFVAKCSVPACHGTGLAPAAGLILSTSGGVQATALSRLAQGSNTGPRSTLTSADNVFGVDMPIIDPHNPGNSWLMYKVDLARPPVTPTPPAAYVCQNSGSTTLSSFAFAPLVPEAQRTADDIERGILSDFILGREMPFPTIESSGYETEPLTFDEREKVRAWIQSLAPGAAVPECGGCTVVTPTDAGVSDSGPADAGAGDAADAGDASDAADQ